MLHQFIVEGANWVKRVDIDDQIFTEYGKQAMEAATRAVESVNNTDTEGDQNPTLGKILSVFEDGSKDDPEKLMYVGTPRVLRNLGQYRLADEIEEVIEYLQHIVVKGDPGKGYKVYGPFPSFDVALEWSKSKFPDSQGDVHIMEMILPD